MKTLALAAVAATMAASTAFAHPVNEPHVCGIDPSTVMDYPASNWVPEYGTVYDRGDYFFIATNDLEAGMSEYTTTHTRIWKDTCAVTGIDIFHSDDNASSGDGTLARITFERTDRNEVTARYMGEELVIPTNRAERRAQRMNEASMNGSAVELDRGRFSYDFSDQDQAWSDLNADATAAAEARGRQPLPAP